MTVNYMNTRHTHRYYAYRDGRQVLDLDDCTGQVMTMSDDNNKELLQLRAMHAALVGLAREHPAECCAYCRLVRQRIDRVLALGPAARVYGLPAKCGLWT